MALRVPTDWVLLECQQHGLFPYAVTVQLLDAVIFGYLFYRVLSYNLKKPWKCPVCDGWGVRSYSPFSSPEHTAQLAKCLACRGEGFIWEQIPKE